MNDFNGRTSIADLHAARVSLLKQQRKSERQLLREERDTLVEWVNKKLGSQHTVSSLTVDFASGVLFARLLLQLCADAGVEDEPGPFDLAPKTGIQKLDNIVTLFAFLRDQGCEMPEDVSPNAIVSKQKRAAQKLLHVLREFEEGGGLRRFAMRASRGGVVRTRGGLNRRADSVAGAGVRRDSLYPTSLAAAAVFLPAPDEESPMALSPIELTPDASPRASEPHTPRPDNAAGAEADVGEGSMTIPSDVEDGSPVVGKRRHKRGATLVIGFNVSASLAPPKSADTREALAPSDQETTSDESTDESPRARRSTRHLADLVDPSEAKELRKKRREQAKRRRDKKAERDASSRRHYDDIAAEVFGDGDAAAASDGDSDSDFGGSVPARRVKDDRANLRGHYGDIENEIFGGAVAEEPEHEADEDSDFGAPAVRKIKDERQNLRGHYADLEAELFGDDQQEQADEDSDFGAPAIKVKDERENLRGHYADLEAELFGDGEETQSPPPKPVVPDLTPQPPRQPPPEPKPSTTIITTTEPSDSDSDSGRDVPAGEPQVGLLVTQPDSREPSDSLRAGSIILTAERAELPNHPNMVPDDSDVEVDRGLAAVPLASAEAVARAKRLARGEEVEEDKKPHAKRLASQGSSTSRLIQQMKRSQIDLITARSGQESSTPANREPDSPLRTRAPHAAPVVTIDSDDESTPHRMARSTSAPDISDAELSPKNATSSQNATPAMVRSQSVSTSLTAEEAASQQQSPPRRKGPKTSKKIQALLYGKKQNKLLDRLGVDEAELKRFRDKPKAYKLMGVAEDSHGHEEPGGSDAADAGDASSVTSSGSSGGGGGKKSKKTASRDAQVLQYEVEESRMIIGDLREQLTVLKERLERRDAALDELQHDIALGPQTSQSMDEEATAIRRRYRTLGMQMAPKPDTLSMMGVHLNKALWSILQEVRGRQGHLMKRRPFNRVFTRWRTRFFELRGSRLIYWENEFHQHEHFRGCLDLTLFKKPQLVQKGDTKSEDENIIRFFPRDAEDATPSPRGGSSNSLSPVDLKSDGGSAETLRWLASIKQRLHLIDYLEKCDANRETGCKEIVHFLLHERADTLRLDRCTDIMIFAAFQHFMTVLQAKETLLYLSLAHVNLSARTLESLGNVIAASSSIKYVNLQHNGITATSVRRFTSSLLINESVEELCLDDNQLQDDGVKLVAELVGQHKTLRLVGLRNNNIGPAGVAHLAAGLTSGKDQKPCFPVIDLGYNRVGDEGCAALVDACCNNPSIEVLDLQHNRITDAGCEVLAAAIRDPASNLKELMLAGNSITSAGVEMLATALQETPSRSTLSIDLSHNPQIAHGGLASLLGVDSQLSMPLLKVARYTPS